MATSLGTALGSAIGTALGNTQTPLETVLSLAATRPVFTADRYIADPVSGKVLAFVDWNDPTHLLIQADPTKQVDIPQPHPDFGGKLCATFSAAGGTFYTSNRSAAAWTFAHNTDGVFVALTLTPTADQSGDYGGTSVSGAPGIRFNATAGSTSMQGVVAGPSGVSAVVLSASGVSTNSPAYYQFDFLPGRSPEALIYRRGSLAGSANTNNPVSSSDPSSPFVLGRRPGGSSISFRWRHLIFAPSTSALTVETRAAVQAYIESDTGSAFSPMLLAPFSWYRGDDVDATTNFDWVDKTGNGHTLRQTTAGAKPTVVTPSEIASREALRFDGVDDYLISTEAASVWTFLHNNSGHEIHAIAVPRAISGSKYLLSTQGSVAYIGLLTGGIATQFRTIYTGDAGTGVVDVNAANAFALNTPVRWSTNAGSGAHETRINNVVGSSGSGITFGTVAPTSTLQIARRSNGTAFLQHDWAELIIFNRKLTSTERNALDAYFISRYGFLA